MSVLTLLAADSPRTLRRLCSKHHWSTPRKQQRHTKCSSCCQRGPAVMHEHPPHHSRSMRIECCPPSEAMQSSSMHHPHLASATCC